MYALMKTSKRNLRKLAAAGSALVVGMVAQSAHAAIDTTSTLAGITEAQTAVLAILGGLLAMSVAIFGIVKVYGFVKRKAGA
jgi:hypothetical protein